MYKGKEPCPGCGTSDKRKEKMKVCFDCERKLKRVESIEETRSIQTKYTQLQWYHLDFKFPGLDWDKYIVIDKTFRNLLKSMSIKHGESNGRLDLSVSGTTSSDRYNTPTAYSEAVQMHYNSLVEFREMIHEYWKQMERSEIDRKNESIEEIKTLKNEIFNSGVTKGKQLLLQLNSGDISETDFEKSFKKY